MGRLRPTRVLARALGAACSRLPAAPTVAEPGGPPTSYYEAAGPVPAPLRRGRCSGSDWTCERVHLPARVPAELRGVPLSEAPIEILHFRPKEPATSPRPLLVMSPILGNRTFLVARFARTFAANGFHAAIIQRKSLEFDPRESVARAEDEVRLLVMRSRQALDWLLQRDDVDATRLGTFGASAGAIVSSMLAGADARFRAHVWLLAGGPLSDVMAHTVEEEYRAYREAAMRTLRRPRAAIRDSLRDALRTDPIQLARHVPTERVLMVLARFDRSVPYRYGLALWKALGRPERVIVPLGHYTTFLLTPWLERISMDYFRRTFSLEKAPGGRPAG